MSYVNLRETLQVVGDEELSYAQKMTNSFQLMGYNLRIAAFTNRGIRLPVAHSLVFGQHQPVFIGYANNQDLNDTLLLDTLIRQRVAELDELVKQYDKLPHSSEKISLYNQIVLLQQEIETIKSDMQELRISIDERSEEPPSYWTTDKRYQFDPQFTQKEITDKKNAIIQKKEEIRIFRDAQAHAITISESGDYGQEEIEELNRQVDILQKQIQLMETYVIKTNYKVKRFLRTGELSDLPQALQSKKSILKALSENNALNDRTIEYLKTKQFTSETISNIVGIFNMMSAQHIKIIGQRQPIMNLSPESLHAIKVVLMEQHKGHKSALPEKAFHCLYKHSILLKYHSEKALMHLGFCAKILQQNGIDLTQLIQKDRLLRLIQTSIDVLPDLASAFKKLSKLSVLNDTHCDMLMEFSKAELECFNACLPTSRNEAFDEESCSVLIKNIQHFKGAPHDLKGCITLMCNNKIEMTDLLGKGKLARLMALPPEELAAVKKIMDEWNKCYPLSDGIINKIIKNASKLPGKEQRICTYIEGMKRDELIANLDILFNPNKQKALRQALDCVRNSQTDQIDSSNVDPIDRTP